MSNHLLEKCIAPHKNYSKDILCVRAINTSEQIAVTQQKSQYCNNS